jgi:hypothetical protein
MVCGRTQRRMSGGNHMMVSGSCIAVVWRAAGHFVRFSHSIGRVLALLELNVTLLMTSTNTCSYIAGTLHECSCQNQ